MASLFVHESGRPAVTYKIGEGTLRIGRHPENTVVLEDESVSSFHAEIVAQAGAFTLSDLNSANGTKLNGQPASTGPLKSGDQILFGNTACHFVDPMGAMHAAPARGNRARPPRNPLGMRIPVGSVLLAFAMALIVGITAGIWAESIAIGAIASLATLARVLQRLARNRDYPLVAQFVVACGVSALLLWQYYTKTP